MDVITPADDERHASAPLTSRGAVDVPARPECVTLARRAVADAGARAGLGPDRLDDLVVAVSEACTNAIEAQLAAGIADPIRVGSHVDGDRLVVAIHDRGPGFDPLSVPVRQPLSDPLELDSERGWGIQLMRALVDAVVFESSPAGTTVRLLVALSDGGEATIA